MAALLTFFELDQTFYLPSRLRRRAKLWLWWYGFLLVNGALALVLYIALHDESAFKHIPVGVRGMMVGAGYLGLVRLKLATIRDQPVGFEFFYDSAKTTVYRRINKITVAARFDEARELANKESLAELALRAKLQVTQDALMSDDEKRASKAWILKTLKSAAKTADDIEERMTLADFLLSGRRPADG